VFGPFLDLGARSSQTCGASSSDTECVVEPIIRTWLAIDGAMQITGAVLLTTGFVFRKKELVSDTYYGGSGGGPRISWWTVVPDVLPGSHYEDPEFSWRWAVAPAAIGFAGSGLGPQHANDLFVGAARTFLDGGYLFEFKFDKSRQHFAFSDPRLRLVFYT